MNKYFLVFSLFSLQLFSQTIELEGGLSYSKFNYQNSSNIDNSNVQPDMSGYLKVQIDTLFSTPLTYGIKFQQQNATGGNQIQAYNWNALYAGPYVNYSFLYFNGFNLKGYSGLSTLLFGEQQIGGEKYRLKNEKEFNGEWLSYGGQATYTIKEAPLWSIIISYSLEQSIKLADQGSEKLNFVNHNFGLIIRLKTPNKVEKVVAPPVVEIMTPVAVEENISNESDTNSSMITTQITERPFGLVSVFFERNKAVVSRHFYGKLESLVAYLKANPNYRLRISGYADAATGNFTRNKALSHNRVKSVVVVLKEMGIKEELIDMNPAGETLDFSQALHDLNRRVDVELIVQ